MSSPFFFRVFEYLLPRSRVWAIREAGFLRDFFMGLTFLPQLTRDFIDQIFLTLLPFDTQEIPLWEEQHGLVDTPLTEAERRSRIDAAWKRTGGQSPRYLQDRIHDAGFTNVFIHEWWELPLTVPPVARNPNDFLAGGIPVFRVEAGEPLAEAGELLAEAGEAITPLGYLLVNKIALGETIPQGCGDELMLCGEETARCGEPFGTTSGFLPYAVPSDPVNYPYVLYWGGEVFPEQAIVSAARKNELEDLLLSLCPAEQWLGVLVTYT